MTPLEDDVREKFAAIAAPDIPAPPTSLLRKRAHRIRATRVVAAAASIAVVAAGAGIGATSLLNRPSHAEYAAGVTAVRGHVPGLPVDERQWQVAAETVGGKHIVAASYLAGTNPCVGFSLTGGWCNTDENRNTVADFATLTRTGAVVAVLGRVSNDARVVDVHFGTQTHRVSAVRTPTSDKMRFFATFFPRSKDDDRYQAVVGVLDAQGKPVPPPVPDEGPVPVLPRSHAPNLPRDQWSLPAGDGGWTSIAYKGSDGSACVAVTGLAADAHEVSGSPRCAATAPAAARVLLEVKLSSGWILMLGDAPTWTTDLIEWGPGGMSSTGALQTPAASDRRFWSLSVPPGNGSRIASCAAGSNCTTVVDLAQLLPHP